MKLNRSVCLICGIGLLGVLSACSTSNYKFIPSNTEGNVSQLSDRAVYLEPASSPSGQVRVMSFGITKIEVNRTEKKTPVLHVWMAISNQGKLPWILKVHDLEISYPNFEPYAPLEVHFEEAVISQLDINSKQLRAIDIYFPLPPTIDSDEKVSSFDFHWKLRAGDREISEVTPFDRIKAPPSVVTLYPYQSYPYPYGVGMGWGSIWWANPSYYPG